MLRFRFVHSRTCGFVCPSPFLIANQIHHAQYDETEKCKERQNETRPSHPRVGESRQGFSQIVYVFLCQRLVASDGEKRNVHNTRLLDIIKNICCNIHSILVVTCHFKCLAGWTGNRWPRTTRITGFVAAYFQVANSTGRRQFVIYSKKCLESRIKGICDNF